MAIEVTPSVSPKIATEILYYEWTCCINTYGGEHPITKGIERLLKYMQDDYEYELLSGKLWQITDTPRKAINDILKELPNDVLDYTLCRDPSYIHSVLEAARLEREREIKRCERIEVGIRHEIEENPSDPDLYNQLRLALWLLGRYKEATAAFKKAKELGWNYDSTLLVAL